MRNNDTQRLISLIQDAQHKKRNKKAIKATFQGAGIIDKNGNLKSPYKNIYFPVNK